MGVPTCVIRVRVYKFTYNIQDGASHVQKDFLSMDFDASLNVLDESNILI